MPFVTEEHEEIRRSVRDFVEKEVKPIANDLDRQNKEIPEHILRKMAELGYFGVIFPEEQGGMGLDYVSMAIVTEELSRGWLGLAGIIGTHLVLADVVVRFGTEDQKRRFLPGLARRAKSLRQALRRRRPRGAARGAPLDLIHRLAKNPHRFLERLPQRFFRRFTGRRVADQTP